MQWSLDKMATILQAPFSNTFSLGKENMDPNDSKSTLVQVMAWCRTSDRPSPKPMFTKFHDAIWRHYATMG